MKKIYTFYKNISIKQKLLLLFSIQIIIPLFFMGTMMYRSTINIVQTKSINYSGDILKMIELRINDFSKNVKAAAQDLLYDRVIYSILSEDENIDEESFSYSEKVDDINNILRKTCLSREEIQSIALISNSKRYYTYDTNSGRASIENLVPYDKILEEARKAKGKSIWFLDYDEEGNIKNIFLTRVIYDISNFKEIGLMAILIRRDNLEAVYGDLSTEFMEGIAISTKSNEWIIGTGENSKKIINSWNEMIFEDNNNYTINNNKLVSYINVDDPDWRVVTEISLDKLNEDLYAFRTYYIIITICTLLILSIFSILMAFDIIDPINKLVQGIKKVQEDKIHEEIIVDRKDELGYLSKCFNNMSHEIDILVNRVYKEQLTRKEAELKTLQAQINPHFLFNTLESINWMARLNDVPEISEMVTALSSLMEAGIGKGVPLVSLKEEVNFVESYILIMKSRYGDRLEFTKNIDGDVLTVKVPKLILQPLVENAIYHGIDQNRGKGKVNLVVKKLHDTINIEIIDNGKGMKKEEVMELNNKFSQVDDDYLISKSSRMGIGLKNVNRRIKLFYGVKYGISIESEYKKYTKVIVTIPINGIEEGAKQYV